MYQDKGLFTDGAASPKTAADQFEEDLCANRHSLLFGLADASWKGPSSAEGANYASSLSQLIGCFHAAQRSCPSRTSTAGCIVNAHNNAHVCFGMRDYRASPTD